MAPDIALGKIIDLKPSRAKVLDPMCGSGTVIRLASEAGHAAIGADLDPLAVLLTRTSAIRSWSSNLTERATQVVEEARTLKPGLPTWIKDDEETSRFIGYWFDTAQAEDLSRLARVLADRPRRDDPLRIALSRLIVTKDAGASLARDTAHSRPHKTRESNDFDVMSGFIGAAATIEAIVAGETAAERPQVRRADARSLSFVKSQTIDLVMTSPPYLNAIDYLRGHRMSLVWLGWTTHQLRELRGETIGAERGLKAPTAEVAAIAKVSGAELSRMSTRHRNMVHRFARDAHDFCRAVARVTKPSGTVVLVVADSQLRGVPISNSGVCAAAAKHHDLKLIKTETREIPARHRYLPPPEGETSSLANRMREEVIFTFRR
ncbi:MAG TPA: hypothetical protein VF520_02200 [Thermoleophilaceae bacterium]|jgi:SAM-dependent methyltransferase